MYRKSIYEKDADFNNAVKKVYELKEKKIDDEEIPKKLASDYQEKEITMLLTDIKRLPYFENQNKLKNLLKLSLWVLLFLKILTVPDVLIALQISVIWRVIIFAISLIVISICLYLAYNEYYHSYETIFIIILISFAYSFDAIVDNIQILFTISVVSKYWWIALSNDVFLISALFTSWKLRKIYPKHLLKLKSIVQKEKLNFS